MDINETYTDYAGQITLYESDFGSEWSSRREQFIAAASTAPGADASLIREEEFSIQIPGFVNVSHLVLLATRGDLDPAIRLLALMRFEVPDGWRGTREAMAIRLEEIRKGIGPRPPRPDFDIPILDDLIVPVFQPPEILAPYFGSNLGPADFSPPTKGTTGTPAVINTLDRVDVVAIQGCNSVVGTRPFDAAKENDRPFLDRRLSVRLA